MHTCSHLVPGWVLKHDGQGQEEGGFGGGRSLRFGRLVVRGALFLPCPALALSCSCPAHLSALCSLLYSIFSLLSLLSLLFLLSLNSSLS
jgi:hypothetical protein